MARPTSPPKDKRQGLIGMVLTLPFKVVGLLALGLFFSIIVEWVGMSFFWKDQGAAHSKNMLKSEIGYLQSDFGTWVTGVKPSTYALEVRNKAHTFMLSDMRLKSALQKTKKRASWVFDYLAALIYTTETFFVRLLVATLSFPAFLIIGMVGLIEGLVQRDLRRFGGGIEHAFTYHIMKRNLKWPIFISWLLYLSLPISIHPNWIFIPAVISFGAGLMMTASTFKKYL